MLFPGNAKLGKHLIWSFSLPSGRADVCVGMTPACKRLCYAARLESYRPSAARRYEENLQLSRRRGFVPRMRAFLIANHVRVLRIHAGGEFRNPRYTRKWLTIIRRSPRVRFYSYTRSWRVPAIRRVLEVMAAEPNMQLWYSVDRDTGLPEAVPAGIRLAWLMTTVDDLPPRPVDLIFRPNSLRRQALNVIADSPVCPAEDGVERPKPMTCDRCKTCWQAAAPAGEVTPTISLTMAP
ncbi:hypothetical protein BH11PLA2_BH11PLA2_29740 [soil metagenome]